VPSDRYDKQRRAKEQYAQLFTSLNCMGDFTMRQFTDWRYRAGCALQINTEHEGSPFFSYMSALEPIVLLECANKTSSAKVFREEGKTV